MVFPQKYPSGCHVRHMRMAQKSKTHTHTHTHRKKELVLGNGTPFFTNPLLFMEEFWTPFLGKFQKFQPPL